MLTHQKLAVLMLVVIKTHVYILMPAEVTLSMALLILFNLLHYYYYRKLKFNLRYNLDCQWLNSIRFPIYLIGTCCVKINTFYGIIGITYITIM